MNRPMKMGSKGHPVGRGPENPRTTIKRLLGYIWKDYKLQVIIVIIAILVSAGAGLAGGYFLRDLFNVYLDPENLDKFAAALVTMGCIYASGALCAYLYNRLMINVTQGTLKKIRDELFIHMETLPIKYFDTNTHGDLMSRYTNDIDAVRQMISQSFPQLISSAITIIGAFVLMIVLSPLMTLVAIVIVILAVFLSKNIAKKSGQYFVKQQANIGAVNGFIEEMIEGAKVIKVFCHEDETKQQFDVLNENLCNAATSANKYSNYLGPIMGNMGHLQYAILAIFGCAISIANPALMDLGTVIAFLSIAKSFSQPINQISQQFASILMALAGAERVFKMMDEPSEVDDGYVTLVNATEENGTLVETPQRTGIWAWKHPHKDGTTTLTKVRGDVRFYEVDFGYSEEKMVLHDVSLYAEPGQKIAFVGATGAGKTTITNLINRFYDVQDGKIRYDDININKIKKDDLRRSLAMVLQDTHLFTGTIRENIRYGKLDATDEEVIAAAKLANADFFIRHLPNGYDTEISGDGGNLSQGQRQLLAIARAAVADPPVLILDEATSSIDTRTESLIEKGMDKLMEGRTVFVIAHRLSTVRNSKAIMVLENGRIIERGSHDSLIEQKGKYYQLYTGAFELS